MMPNQPSTAATLAALGACAAVALFSPVAARAADDAPPQHFACSFSQGHSWSYAGGKFAEAPPSKMAFEIQKIDLDGQSAELILESKAAGKLRVIRALNANHFLEVANEGFLNLTTVYDREGGSGPYPAVHSRHFGLLGQPLFAQYAGTCEAK